MTSSNTTKIEGDQPFEHYSWKHKVIAWVSRTFFDNITYTVKHGKLAGFRRKGGLGWLPEAIAGAELNAEERFWREVDLGGKTVYDIGAFHGLLTLLFSRRARQVVSFEPNPNNRRRLEENLALNRIGNVRVRDVALAATPGQGYMIWDPAAPGGARVVPGDGGERGIVLRTLDEEVLGGLPAPDFVKIDVEGFEQQVLRGGRETLRRYQPELFVELHGNTMNEKRANVAAVVELLVEFGYVEIRHIESNQLVRPGKTDEAARGHLYCPRPTAASLGA